jgi:cytochrome c oxidase assembly factor CtaG
MIKHLLLMTFAPALFLLSDSIRAFWFAIPQFAQRTFGAVFRRPLVHGFGRVVTKPAVCWACSAFTLIAWHVPALFSMAARSNFWHTVEQATFFGAGLLFWWPVVQPWPSARTSPSWPVLLYLFLATLPCDILSGFLVFSDRVAYPVYLSAPRWFGFSALEDQQCAAALMWTCVTIVYLVPAAIISIKLLAPATSQQIESAHSDISGTVLPASEATSLEVV